MTKKAIIAAIETRGMYTSVRIDKSGDCTGMLTAENYRYKPRNNMGGRRYIGNIYAYDFNLIHNIEA